MTTTEYPKPLRELLDRWEASFELTDRERGLLISGYNSGLCAASRATLAYDSTEAGRIQSDISNLMQTA
jgi:hypothetical protein